MYTHRHITAGIFEKLVVEHSVLRNTFSALHKNIKNNICENIMLVKYNNRSITIDVYRTSFKSGNILLLHQNLFLSHIHYHCCRLMTSQTIVFFISNYVLFTLFHLFRLLTLSQRGFQLFSDISVNFYLKGRSHHLSLIHI